MTRASHILRLAAQQQIPARPVRARMPPGSAHHAPILVRKTEIKPWAI
jgi:hypothetical protein